MTLTPDDPLADMASLSLKARLGVALHLFASYCRQRRLDHPDVNQYLEHMWGFVALPDDGKGFVDCDSDSPDLVYTGLGCEYPAGFESQLAAQGIAEPEFRMALIHTTEVLYGSLFAAADNEQSLRDLKELASISAAAGVVWPDLSAFAGSRWEKGGWGSPLTVEELARWRAAGREHT